MTTILNGLLGGLLVGLVAAVVTRFVTTESPATTSVGKGMIGPRAGASGWRTLLIRVAYGGLAGSVFLVLELLVLRVLAVPPTVGEAFGVAIAWSVLLLGMNVVVRRFGPSLAFDRARLGRLVAYHLVFGVGFGIWIRTTWIT